MDVCVVLTALNDEGTIIESIESVLSQVHYPDQIGFAHGPSRDQTEDFAGFYREEFDFIHWDSRIDPAGCGLMHLRLGVLDKIQTSHVLFLRANSYLYRDALERVIAAGETADLVVAPLRFMSPDRESWDWSPPGSLSTEDLLRTGPVHPSALLWRTDLLREVYTELQTLKLGPFSTLGWLCCLWTLEPTLNRLESPLVETWDFREGEHCWTGQTYDQFGRLLEDLDVDSETSAPLRTVLSRGFTPPGFSAPADSGEEVESSTVEGFDWLLNHYPMVE